MKGIILVNLLLTFILGNVAWSQPNNNSCNDPDTLCPNVVFSGTTVGANVTVCPDCEDDFVFCFTPKASVWYVFKTNQTGGDVAVDISNVSFTSGINLGSVYNAAIVEYVVNCDAATYTPLGNCLAGQTGNGTLTATGLLPNSYYKVIVDGGLNGSATQPARVNFDIEISGSGVDRSGTYVTITDQVGEVCPSEPLNFVAYTLNCQDSSDFTWYVNGTLKAVTQTNFWQVSNLQNNDVVSVTCRCFESCSVLVSDTATPIQMNNLTLDAGADLYVDAGTEVLLSALSNGIYFYWEPVAEVSNPSSQTTVVQPSITTTYSITAANDNCSLTDNVTVFVTDAMTIPGSFSPNGDGINDRWLIPGIEFYPNAQMKIYSRWGQVITEITGYGGSKSWDGSYLGKPAPDGTYFYVLQLSSDDEPQKGTVTIIR